MSTALAGKTGYPSQVGDRILLQNISWHTYEALLRDLEQQPGTRLTYDRGRLRHIRRAIAPQHCPLPPAAITKIKKPGSLRVPGWIKACTTLSPGLFPGPKIKSKKPALRGV